MSEELKGDEVYVTVASAIPYVQYVAKAYEIITQMWEFGRESKTDKALRLLNDRVAKLEQDVRELDDRLSQLEGRVAQGENRARLNRIIEHTIEFVASARMLQSHPEDAADVANNTLDRLRVMFEDDDLWMWSDAIRKPSDAAPGLRQAAPRFKGMPVSSFAVGTILWAFAAQQAITSGGSRATYSANAEEILGWVSTRTDFVRNKMPPVSIVERFRDAVWVEIDILTRYASPAGNCEYGFSAVNNIDRTRKLIRTVDSFVGRPLAATMCTPNPRIADGEEAVLEDETPEIRTLMLVEDAVSRIKNRGTLSDKLTGEFPNWTAHTLTLYGIEPSGDLRRFEIETTTELVKPPTVTKIGDVVGIGWQNFTDVFCTYNTVMYAFSDNGAIDWYREDNVADGPAGWAGPTRVRPPRGFMPLGFSSTYINGGGGSFYHVWMHSTGLKIKRSLERMVHADPRNGNGVFSDSVMVAPEWPGYTVVFGGDDGVIYGIDETGDLYWHKHSQQLNKLEGPVKIGNGWNGFDRVFAFGEGFIAGQYANGEMMLYHFQQWRWGPKGEARVWHGPVRVAGTQWRGFQRLIPMIGDAPPIIN